MLLLLDECVPRPLKHDLIGQTNRIKEVRPLASQILTALDRLRLGEVIRIGA